MQRFAALPAKIHPSGLETLPVFALSL